VPAESARTGRSSGRINFANRGFAMKSKIASVGLAVAAFAFGTSVAHAGALRATGKQIGKTSAVVAAKTADAAGAAAGGVANAGKATGGAIKDGAPSAGKGIAAAPGVTARGTARASKAVWKAVW
jgi:hypothetical protein